MKCLYTFSFIRNNDRFRDGLTVAEIIQLLEEDIQGIVGNDNGDDNIEVEDIFIAPPPANELTDEDSGDEDTGGLLDNLCGNQLVSEAEAVLSNGIRIGGPVHDLSGYSAKREREWIDGDLVDSIKKDGIFPEDYADKYKNMTPVQIFEIFIDEEVISLFLTETKKYALSKNESNMNVTAEEKGFSGCTDPFWL